MTHQQLPIVFDQNEAALSDDPPCTPRQFKQFEYLNKRGKEILTAYEHCAKIGEATSIIAQHGLAFVPSPHDSDTPHFSWT